MWFLDTNHPNFFARLVARCVWLVIIIALSASALVLIVWGYDTFGHHHLAHTIRDKVNWAWHGGWKQVLTEILAVLFIGPIVMDMLFGGTPGPVVVNNSSNDRAMMRAMARQERNARRDERRRQRNGGGL